MMSCASRLIVQAPVRSAPIAKLNCAGAPTYWFAWAIHIARAPHAGQSMRRRDDSQSPTICPNFPSQGQPKSGAPAVRTGSRTLNAQNTAYVCAPVPIARFLPRLPLVRLRVADGRNDGGRGRRRFSLRNSAAGVNAPPPCCGRAVSRHRARGRRPRSGSPPIRRAAVCATRRQC